MKLNKIISVLLTAAVVCSSALTFSIPVSAASGISTSKTYTWEYTAVKLKPQNSADKIYYTTDGTDPTTKSKLYTKALGFRSATVLKAAEFDKNGNLVGKIRTIDVKRKCPTPKFLVSDRLDGTAKVEITDLEPGMTIHFTTNGKDPTEKSTVLDGAYLVVKKDKTIKAIAVKDGWITSDVAVISPLDQITGDSYSDYVKQALKLTNAERKKAGLPEVKLNQKLCDAAYIRAGELMSNYDNGHTRTNGTRWTTALADQGYIHRIAAENYLRIPNSGVDPERAMELWMSSEIHRENILREGVEDVGFGFVQDGIYCYWIQLFGKLM